MTTITPGEALLRDRIDVGDLADVHRILVAMHRHFRGTCQWIIDNKQRTERTLVLFKLLSAASDHLHAASHNLQTHASTLALATRSLYELNLRIRHVLASNDNVRSWQAEACSTRSSRTPTWFRTASARAS